MSHFLFSLGDDPPIHLGRAPRDECTGVDVTCGGCAPFVNRHIISRENTVFELKIGPSGNERGYQAITGEDTGMDNNTSSLLLVVVLPTFMCWCMHIHTFKYTHTRTTQAK